SRCAPFSCGFDPVSSRPRRTADAGYQLSWHSIACPGTEMAHFLLWRLLLTIPVLLGVATLVFSLIHLVPGDPVQAMLGESASPADITELRGRLGVERPR